MTLEEMAKAIDAGAIEEANSIFRSLFVNFVSAGDDYKAATDGLVSSYGKLNRFQAEAKARIAEKFKDAK